MTREESASGARSQRGVWGVVPPQSSEPVVVCAALGVEVRALSRGVARCPVVRVGPRARHAGRLAGIDFAALAVAGFGGGLDPALRPGDVLVATEIRAAGGGPVVPCGTAPVLAAELAKDGIRAAIGPLITADHIVRGRRERAELAASGGLAVDMESAALAALARARPHPVEVAALRVIVDTPDDPLLRPGTLRNGLAARRVLRRAGPALERWGAIFDRNEVSS